MSGYPTSIPARIIAAADDARSAQAIKAQLREQTWPQVEVIFPIAKAIAAARAQGALILFSLEGLQLGPMALEAAWWALETQPQFAFAALGDERGRRTPMLDAAAQALAIRGAALAAAPDSNEGGRAALAAVFSALKEGGRGILLREPLTARPARLRAPEAEVARVLAQLRSQGMNDAGLGDTGYDLPPSEWPMQTLDERPSPPAQTPRMVAKGKHRVLALLQGFPMGGYAAFNADFLPRLVAAGHGLTVCATEMWRTDWQLEAVRRASGDISFAPGIVSLDAIPRYVSHIIESRDIEVVLVSHAFNAYRMLAWLRRRHPRVAFVDYVHTDWFESSMYGSYAALSAAHAEWLDIQIASSRMLAGELVRRGARAESTRAITINLDTRDWDPARYPRDESRRALGCAPGQPLILFAGRTSSEKRPLFAVECWKGLIAAGVDARFAVAGGGPQLQEMKSAVSAAGLKSRVVFLGELETAALRHVYAAADVFHAPSEIEGIARSLFEAMAMECVPVVADVGGQRELVDAECGFILPHGADELWRYIEALKLAISPELNPALAKRARARIVEQFDSSLCVAAFEAAFEAALERRRALPVESSGISPAAARELALCGLEISRRHFWRAVQLRAAQTSAK